MLSVLPLTYDTSTSDVKYDVINADLAVDLVCLMYRRHSDSVKVSSVNPDNLPCDVGACGQEVDSGD